MTEIKPITYLKNHTAELVRKLSEEGGHVTITQNGEARVVVMDTATYERWRKALAMLKMVALGEADAAAGRTVSHEQAFDRARAAVKRVSEE